MSRILLIFLDGVGIGPNDPSKNPFFSRGFEFINQIFHDIPHLEKQEISHGNNYIFPVDALMGVSGIPQSGTGQTSILCGVNASELIGQHFGPFPHSKLMNVIKEKNLFAELLSMNKSVYYANAFPHRFFDYLESGKKRVGVFASSCLLTGIELHGENQIQKGEAISAEITNKVWNDKLGYNLQVLTPEESAGRLLTISGKHDFTLYEFFLTDHLGHGRNRESFEEILTAIDLFLLHLLKNIPEDTTLLICSDHGNLEDISIKQHTLNPAIGLTSGEHASRLATEIKKLYHIKPAIINVLS